VYELAGVQTNTATGVYHNALDDAHRQAFAVAQGFRRLGLHPGHPRQWIAAIVRGFRNLRWA
ncbi:hypothetical protein L6232_26600, partial [Shewanella sp. C31]|nr:hypothetical protein [Shewanella electrica]